MSFVMEMEWKQLKAEHLQQFDLKSFDDELLVMGCLAGDEEVWQVLLERYSRLIYTVGYSFGFPTTVVDEIFQDVCLQMLNKLYTLKDRSKLKAWLVTVTKRLCSQRKKKMSQVVLSSEYLEEIFADDMVLEESVLRSETQLAIDKALVQLDDRSRYLIEALFFSEPKISYDVVALQLGLSAGSIGPIRQRCLDKLRGLVLEIDGQAVSLN